METTVKKLENDDLQVTVVVPAQDCKSFIDKHYKKIGKQRVPGFRPGKAPRNILDNLYGGKAAVYNQIAEDMVNELAPLQIDEQDILFIENPKFEPLPTLEDGKDFTFVLSGPVKPTVELTDYSAPTVKIPSVEVTDEEVQAQIEMFATYYNDFEEITDRGAKDHDYVELDLECTANGEPVAGLKDDSRMMELGTESMPKNFEKEIIGMKIGESKEFDFSVKGEQAYAFIGSDTVHANVTLKSIKEKHAPEINDDFAKKMGSESLDKLKETMRATLGHEKQHQVDELKEKLVHEEMAKRVKGEISKTYLDYNYGVSLYDFYNKLQREGLTFDQVLASEGIDKDQFDEEFRQQSDELAAQTLALDAIANKLEMTVSEQDIDEEFQVAKDPEATKKKWKDTGRMTEIREAILRKNASEWLVANATYEELKPGETLDEEKDKKEKKKEENKKAKNKKETKTANKKKESK